MYALTEACKYTAGKIATVYSNSAHACGAAYSFASVWAQKGFLQADCTPAKHASQRQDLSSTIQLPTTLAIVKCVAHTQGSDLATRGNNVADIVAK